MVEHIKLADCSYNIGTALDCIVESNNATNYQVKRGSMVSAITILQDELIHLTKQEDIRLSQIETKKRGKA